MLENLLDSSKKEVSKRLIGHHANTNSTATKYTQYQFINIDVATQFHRNHISVLQLIWYLDPETLYLPIEKKRRNKLIKGDSIKPMNLLSLAKNVCIM